MLPVITDAGVLEVKLAAPDGGIRDLGPMALTTTAQFPAPSEMGALQPQGLFQEGHTYLMKLRNQLALVRVVRIRSSVNPRLAAIDNAGERGSGTRGGQRTGPGLGRVASSGDLVGDISDQQRTDRILSGAQITIDLEWLTQQDR